MWFHLLFHENRPGVDFSFLGGVLPPGVTLARASSGTAFNSAGTLASYPADVPRFDTNPATLAPRGVLSEAQRTNIVVSSGDLTNAVWNKSNCSVVNDVGQTNLFGSAGTSKVVPDTSNSIHRTQWQFNPTNGSTYAVTVFLKAAGVRYVFINVKSNLNAGLCVDLQNGTYTTANSPSNVTVSLLANGFYKVTFTGIGQNMTGNFIWLQANSSFVASDTTYTGNGTDGFYVGGVQVEVGADPSSYILTSGSAVTRAADQISFTIPSGVSTLRATFDDGSTQDLAVSAGTYTVPTNLSRSAIARIRSV